ncbi:MAG: DUF4339 domain-containing protein [Methylacidiphilales bacterium]|nr:DUF4339 domain-containing protein [Candidatus Methylacidiphilales bacterium]
MAAKQEPLFYIAWSEQEEDGPYDIVQMAGLLRRKMITGETPTRREGEEHWQPFSWHPEFIVAREMPPGAVSQRAEALRDEGLESASPIPLPSREFILQIVGMVIALLIVGVAVYFIARADTPIGICLAVAGAGAALVGTCLMYVRLMDEDYLTILMIFFIPLYDIYYFLSNFWDYLPYFCARYVGGVMAVTALAGVASVNPTGTGEITYLLHFYGL